MLIFILPPRAQIRDSSHSKKAADLNARYRLGLPHPARGDAQDSRLIFYQWSQSVKKIQLIGGQENIIKIDETPRAVFNYEQAEQIGGTQ